MSNCNFFHNVFYAISALKSFNSHFSVALCSFFVFGMVSKWLTREWVNCGSLNRSDCEKEKEKNADQHHFLLVTTCFQKLCLSGFLELEIFGEKLDSEILNSFIILYFTNKTFILLFFSIVLFLRIFQVATGIFYKFLLFL